MPDYCRNIHPCVPDTVQILSFITSITVAQVSSLVFPPHIAEPILYYTITITCLSVSCVCVLTGVSQIKLYTQTCNRVYTDLLISSGQKPKN